MFPLYNLPAVFLFFCSVHGMHEIIKGEVAMLCMIYTSSTVNEQVLCSLELYQNIVYVFIVQIVTGNILSEPGSVIIVT